MDAAAGLKPRARHAAPLPCGFAGGLPVGMQLIGNYFDEARLLNVAHRYQMATDWHQRRPDGLA